MFLEKKAADSNEIIEMLEKEKMKLNEMVFKGNVLRLESDGIGIRLDKNTLGSFVCDNRSL